VPVTISGSCDFISASNSKTAFSLFAVPKPSWLHPSRTSQIDDSTGR
jgi:hypothetical protein